MTRISKTQNGVKTKYINNAALYLVQVLMEADNYYYRARYYKPEVGRFLQTDPLEYVDSMNLYLYVDNNPVILTDPYGEKGHCGPEGWPGSPIIDYPFGRCCKKHDECYSGKGSGGCGTSKSKCDNDFCGCMLKRCIWLGYCDKAITFCVLVKTYGDKAFNKARDKNCPPPCP